MVSIVIPYFKREDVLKKNLENYRKLYKNLVMEFIVVNDGDNPPDVDAKIINLPEKDYPLNPCVPINVGVREAKFDLCVITGPEIFHRKPILYDMADRTEKSFYSWVTAACWAGKRGQWDCHTSVNKIKHKADGISEQAGFHFMAMFHRSFFLSFGGMDERYRNGYCFDDNDLICTLDQQGAKFTCFDNLVTDHLETPRLKWHTKIGTNRSLFKSKWEGIYNLDLQREPPVSVHPQSKNRRSIPVEVLPEKQAR